VVLNIASAVYSLCQSFIMDLHGAILLEDTASYEYELQLVDDLDRLAFRFGTLNLYSII
jgi:hypothetical protein